MARSSSWRNVIGVGQLRRYPWLLVGVHAVLFAVAYALAYLLRFDFDVPAQQWLQLRDTLPVLLVVRLVVFSGFQVYKGVWRYVGLRDLIAITQATTLSSLVFLAAVVAFFGHGTVPRSVLAIDWMLCLLLVAGARLAIRASKESGLRAFIRAFRQSEDRPPKRRAVIVGAGEGAEELIRALSRNSRVNYHIVGLVDDDPFKQHRRIHGIEVIGTIDQLSQIAKSRGVEELLLAVPSATSEERRAIAARCKKAEVPIKTVPSLHELLEGRVGIAQLQDLTPEDLIGRAAVRIDTRRLREEILGKSVLVTGAGGSVGSELCRQVAVFNPRRLVLLERAESNLYAGHLQLRQEFPTLDVIPVVGDILDRRKVDEVIDRYKPDLVYHAAAYKHVPLMEEHPLQAIENNVFGTEVVAEAARKAGVPKFVFISTDKAVRPVGVMGMTKRVAEDLLLSFGDGPTAFVSVRFGNVLGSDGSVLPLFRWQLAMGGPLTVTDPDASRFFMLLSEAAQLVLQAGAMGRGGEVFFLDMGEPVRILELAENLIRLSGLAPGRDVSVEVIGLRPGERLREELFLETEDLLESEHEKVFVLQKQHFDPDRFRIDLEKLRDCYLQGAAEEALRHLAQMAASY